VARSLIDLSQWTKQTDWPRVLCPICQTGTVGPKQLLTQLTAESKQSVELAKHYEGPWEELSGTFSGVLVCDYSRCAQELAVAGDYAYTYDFDDFDGYGNPPLVEMYRLRFVQPALVLLRVPPRTPNGVRAEVIGASELLFLNPSAAGNRLRRAVEELMDAQRIRKTTTDRKTGKPMRASLHARINEFGGSNPDQAEVLLAVKWIGNDATHGRELGIADVMTCAEVLEAALISLYDRSDSELRALVRKINKQKGVARRRSSKSLP
jgi:hypothetical protein